MRSPVRRATLAGWLAAALVAPAAGTVAQAQAVTAADVDFVRGMIVHHRQALEMTALIAGRTTRASLRLLGERIDVSQRDEIAMMEGWLRRHAPAVPPGADTLSPPPGAAAHAHHAPAMPGMLGAEAMAQLAAASGDDFDRRFLEGMIAHHRGALAMVAALLKAPGSARQPQLHQMVIDVDADQRAEIARMERLLATMPAVPAGKGEPAARGRARTG